MRVGKCVSERPGGRICGSGGGFFLASWKCARIPRAHAFFVCRAAPGALCFTRRKWRVLLCLGHFLPVRGFSQVLKTSSESSLLLPGKVWIAVVRPRGLGWVPTSDWAGACFLTVGILVSKQKYDQFVQVDALQRSAVALRDSENKCLFMCVYIHIYK